ncbi:MAG: hypothetical protein AAFO69_20100 [Bacteroidota bacterium]
MITESNGVLTSTDTVDFRLNFTTLGIGLQYELKTGSYFALGSGFNFFKEGLVTEKRSVINNGLDPPVVNSNTLTPFSFSNIGPTIYVGVGHRMDLGQQIDLVTELRYARISGFDSPRVFNSSVITSRLSGLQVMIGLRY